MTDNDSPEVETPGTTRRRFLGAAAALSGLLAATPDTSTAQTQPTPENVSSDATGTTRAGYDATTGAFSAFELKTGGGQFNTPVEVSACHYDDTDGEVELVVHHDAAQVHVGLDPDQARDLGEKLLAGADHADNGVEATHDD